MVALADRNNTFPLLLGIRVIAELGGVPTCRRIHTCVRGSHGGIIGWLPDLAGTLHEFFQGALGRLVKHLDLLIACLLI